MKNCIFKVLAVLDWKAILIVSVLFGHNSDVLAATKNVKYLYRPDPGNPVTNAFVPVNPERCATHLDITCGVNEYGISIGPTYLDSPISARGALRDSAMFRADTDWRQITLVNTRTGDAALADIRVSGLSGKFRFSESVISIVGNPDFDFWRAHDALWSGRGWVYAPAPCRNWLGRSSGNIREYHFALRPSNVLCGKMANYDIPGMGLISTIVTYEVMLPRPQSLQAGTYVGSEVYSVGPDMDIDFGDKILHPESELKLDFELEVDPILRVDFPGGSNILSLAPEGGWMAWLQRGRKPTRLWRDQNFDLSSSVPFSMSLVCEHVQGDNCAINNGKGHQVPVETRVTLPAGMRDSTGGAVRGYRLTHLDRPEFSPTEFVIQRQATLHFEVPKDDMETMLRHAGTRYSGDVTIVWDADI